MRCRSLSCANRARALRLPPSRRALARTARPAATRKPTTSSLAPPSLPSPCVAMDGAEDRSAEQEEHRDGGAHDEPGVGADARHLLAQAGSSLQRVVAQSPRHGPNCHTSSRPRPDDRSTGDPGVASQLALHRKRSGPSGPVAADGAGRRPVADQLHPRVVGRRGGALDVARRGEQADAAVPGAQPERRQVADRGPEAGGPQDHVDGLERAVGPADPVGLDPREHRASPVGAAPRGLLLLVTKRDAGHRHHRPRRQPAADTVGDQADRRATVELPGEVAPHRLAAGHPDGVGDRRDLAEQLHRARSPADHQDPLAAEVLGARVVDGVQLLAEEGFLTRVVRHERPAPGAGGVDHRPRGPGALPRPYDEQVTALLDRGHPDRAQDRQAVAALVLAEPARDHVVGPLSAAPGRGAVGQVGHAVDVVHRQRVPAVLPGPAGPLLGVEDDVVETEPSEVVRRRQPGLPGADDHRVERGVEGCAPRSLQRRARRGYAGGGTTRSSSSRSNSSRKQASVERWPVNPAAGCGRGR